MTVCSTDLPALLWSLHGAPPQTERIPPLSASHGYRGCPGEWKGSWTLEVSKLCNPTTLL